MHITIFPVQWRPIDVRVEREIDGFLKSWEGVPYSIGRGDREQGSDCVYFMCNFLNHMWKRSSDIADALQGDVALHKPRRARKAFQRISREFVPHKDHIKDMSLEPGDILVVGPRREDRKKVPSHAMIAGGRKHTLWHATSRGIRQTGIGLDSSYELLHILRPSKEDWRHAS